MLCSLARQGDAKRSVKGLGVWANRGTKGYQGQVEGFQAVVSQFGDAFSLLRGVFISGLVSYGFPYYFGQPIWGWFSGVFRGISLRARIPGFSLLLWVAGRCWVVLCSLLRQGGANRRAKCLRVGATRCTEGCQGQVGRALAVLHQFGGVVSVFRGLLILGTDRRAEGLRAGATTGT